MENNKQINQAMFDYKKRMYELMDKEQLIEKILEYEDRVNIREAIKVDSHWISKYDSLASNLYLLKSQLVREHEYLQKDVYNLTAHNRILVNMVINLSKKPREEVIGEISKLYLEAMSDEII